MLKRIIRALPAVALVAVSGCTIPEQNVIKMVAESFPTKTSINVIVDAVDQLDRRPDLGMKYPVDLVKTTPYTHLVVYDKTRFKVTMTMTVIATEPGQTVLCSVWFNGVLVPTAAGHGEYGKGKAALCVYPPRIPKR